MKTDQNDEMVKYLKALTFLQLHQMTNGASFQRVEFLLSRAGFGYKEIADLLGKKEGAVAVTIHRAKAHTKKGSRHV